MSSRAGLTLACALGLAVVTGCGEDRRLPPPPAGPDRWVRSFVPVSDQWIPESEVHTAQEEPRQTIWELNADPTLVPPTPEQIAAADAFEARCLEAAREKGWFDFEVAVRDGYKLMHSDKRHYYNEEYVFDDVVLDCERPEFLMYYGTPTGKVLAGVMFFPADASDRGPQIGGSSTLWHYHVYNSPVCMREGLLKVRGPIDGKCPEGSPELRSSEMLHLWFLRHPGGRFGTNMALSRADLERAVAERVANESGSP